MARFFHSDIPFNRDDAHRFLPMIIGLMVCLTGLFLTVALSLAQVVIHNRNADLRLVQVTVPYVETGGSGTINEAQETLVTRAMSALAGIHGIESITRMSEADMARLLKPWAGDALPLDELPLPVALTVHLTPKGDSEPLVAKMRDALAEVHRDIAVDHTQQWLDRAIQFTSMLMAVAIVLAALMISGLIAMVVLAARTSLKLNFKTVALLHNIGAQDDYIARQFVAHGLSMMLRGATFGTGLAILLAIAFSLLLQQLNSPLLPTFTLSPLHIALFIALPIVTACATFIAVRMNVRRMLGAMH